MFNFIRYIKNRKGQTLVEIALILFVFASIGVLAMSVSDRTSDVMEDVGVELKDNFEFQPVQPSIDIPQGLIPPIARFSMPTYVVTADYTQKSKMVYITDNSYDADGVVEAWSLTINGAYQSFNGGSLLYNFSEGVNTVRLQVEDNDGLFSTVFTKTITVEVPDPPPPPENFSISLIGKTNVTVGDSADSYRVVINNWGGGTTFGDFGGGSGLRWSRNYNKSSSMISTSSVSVIRPVGRDWESQDVPSYKIRVEAINDVGEVAFDEITVTVNETFSNQDFKIRISGNNSAKVGESYNTYSLVIDNWGNGSTYGDYGGGNGVKWSGNYNLDTTMWATTKTSVARPYRNTAGRDWEAQDKPKYKIRVEAINDAGQTASAELEITVDDTSPFQISLNGPSTVNEGDLSSSFNVTVDNWGEGSTFKPYTSIGGLKWSTNYNISTTLYETSSTTISRPYNRDWEAQDIPSYLLRVEAQNDANQTAYAEKTINVVPAPVANQIPVAVITSPDEQPDNSIWVYANDTVQLTGKDSYDNDGTVSGYEWKNPSTSYAMDNWYMGKDIIGFSRSNYSRVDTVQLQVEDDTGNKSTWVSKQVTSWKFYPEFMDISQRIQDTNGSSASFMGTDNSKPSNMVKNREWSVSASHGWDDTEPLPTITPSGVDNKNYTVSFPRGQRGGFVISLKVSDDKGHSAIASELFFIMNSALEFDFYGTKYRRYYTYDEEITPDKISEVPNFSPKSVRDDLISKLVWLPDDKWKDAKPDLGW